MTTIHHPTTPAAHGMDKDSGPRTHMAFEELQHVIFDEGALDHKTKQLIAVAVAHNTGCPLCIEGHTALAVQAGATPQEITESIWVAVEVHAGGTFAHATRAHQADQASATGRNRDGRRS
jgi:AhpD family alkylhydroperoxidase